MNETERWIRQAREHLSKADKGRNDRLVDDLQEHLRKMDFDRAALDLGCGDSCAECSWGTLGGYPLRETCGLVRFLKAAEEIQDDQGRLEATSEQRKALLALLDALPVGTKA